MTEANSGIEEAAAAPVERSLPGLVDVTEPPVDTGASTSTEGLDSQASETIPDYDTELAAWFDRTTAALSIPEAAVRALHDSYVGRLLEERALRAAQVQVRSEAAAAALRREWGGEYGANLKLVGKLVAEYGGPELHRELARTGLADNVALIKALARLGRHAFAAQGGVPQLSPIEARREIMRLRADTGFMAAYSHRAHAQNAVAQQQMDELYAIAYPPSKPRQSRR